VSHLARTVLRRSRWFHPEITRQPRVRLPRDCRGKHGLVRPTGGSGLSRSLQAGGGFRGMGVWARSGFAAQGTTRASTQTAASFWRNLAHGLTPIGCSRLRFFLFLTKEKLENFQGLRPLRSRRLAFAVAGGGSGGRLRVFDARCGRSVRTLVTGASLPAISGDVRIQGEAGGHGAMISKPTPNGLRRSIVSGIVTARGAVVLRVLAPLHWPTSPCRSTGWSISSRILARRWSALRVEELALRFEK